MGRMSQELVVLQNVRACLIIDLLPAVKLAAVAFKPGLRSRCFLHLLYVWLCRKRVRAVSMVRVTERSSCKRAGAAVMKLAA